MNHTAVAECGAMLGSVPLRRSFDSGGNKAGSGSTALAHPPGGLHECLARLPAQPLSPQCFRCSSLRACRLTWPRVKFDAAAPLCTFPPLHATCASHTRASQSPPKRSDKQRARASLGVHERGCSHTNMIGGNNMHLHLAHTWLAAHPVSSAHLGNSAQNTHTHTNKRTNTPGWQHIRSVVHTWLTAHTRAHTHVHTQAHRHTHTKHTPGWQHTQSVAHTWFAGVVSPMWCSGCGVAAGRSGRLPTTVWRTVRRVRCHSAKRPAPCAASTGAGACTSFSIGDCGKLIITRIAHLCSDLGEAGAGWAGPASRLRARLCSNACCTQPALRLVLNLCGEECGHHWGVAKIGIAQLAGLNAQAGC